MTEVVIPAPSPYSSSAYLKYRVREAIDFPLVGVAVNIALDSKNGMCEQASVAIGAVAPKPVKVSGINEILKGKKVTDELIEEVGKAAFNKARPVSNLIGCTPHYRKRLVKIFAKRAIHSALQNITAG